jgi:Beta propeller domain
MQTAWQATDFDMQTITPDLVAGYIQVSSFDASSSDLPASDLNPLGISASGVFIPMINVDSVFYSSDTIVVPFTGYSYNEEIKSTDPNTLLVVFALNGARSATQAVGGVPGTMSSDQSVDVANNVVRIATYIDTGCDYISKDAMAVPDAAECYTLNYITTLQVPNSESASTTEGRLNPLDTESPYHTYRV